MSLYIFSDLFYFFPNTFISLSSFQNDCLFITYISSSASSIKHHQIFRPEMATEISNVPLWDCRVKREKPSYSLIKINMVIDQIQLKHRTFSVVELHLWNQVKAWVAPPALLFCWKWCLRYRCRLIHNLSVLLAFNRYPSKVSWTWIKWILASLC